jgi:hypothetical protein
MANNKKLPLLILIFTAALTITSVCSAASYWINEIVQVSAGGASWWSGTLYARNHLQGSFTSGGGGIKFYILDASNFARYQNGQFSILTKMEKTGFRPLACGLK